MAQCKGFGAGLSNANETSAASRFYTSWRQTNDKAKTTIKDLCSDSSKLWLRKSRRIIYTAGQQPGIISGMNHNSVAPSTILLFWEPAWFSCVSVLIPVPHIYIYNTLSFRDSELHTATAQLDIFAHCSMWALSSVPGHYPLSSDQQSWQQHPQEDKEGIGQVNSSVSCEQSHKLTFLFFHFAHPQVKLGHTAFWHPLWPGSFIF